jgi:hypothetical protein
MADEKDREVHLPHGPEKDQAVQEPTPQAGPVDDLPPPPPRTNEGTVTRTTVKLTPGRRKTNNELQKTITRRINRLKKEKAKIEKPIATVKSQLSKAIADQKKLKQAISGHGPAVITSDIIAKSGPVLEASVKKNVIFEPNPGPQTEFLAASEKEVLYGGARGGGKSYSMLVDPLRYCHKENHRGVLLRRTLGELGELIHKSKLLYPKAFKGATYKEQSKEWTFPSGARIQFGYAESADDRLQYQGQAYTWIGIDEIGQFPDPGILDDLRGSLRSVDPEIPTFIRATANPGGSGGLWLKKMFIDPSPPNVPFEVRVNTPLGEQVLTRRFIPAKLVDNPYLTRTPDYMMMLSTLNEAKRKQWLEGDWDVTEGAAFPEFNREIHTIDPFPLPKVWPRFRAADWGYASPACVLWFAVDFDDTIYIYRELYTKGLNAEEFAREVVRLEKEDPNARNMRGIMDSSVWAKRGDVGPSIPEVMMRNGCRWAPSDRSPGSVYAGKQEVHRRLAIDPFTKKPRLRIFKNCTNLIATLPTLPLDKDHPEDVDSKAEDHAYDALRYGLMSRPMNARRALSFRNETYRPLTADNTFGY